MSKICYWDPDAQEQRERDMTPAEEAQRLVDIAAATAPIVPAKVTRRQAIAVLRINGITLAMIEAAIMTLPISDLEKDLALIDLNESTEFEYDWPMLVQVCAAMHLDRTALFVAAAKL